MHCRNSSEISSFLLGTLVAAVVFLFFQEVASAQTSLQDRRQSNQQTTPRQGTESGQWETVPVRPGQGQGTGWGESGTVRRPGDSGRPGESANPEQGMFDWARPVAGPTGADRNTPTGYFQGERQSSRDEARGAANTPVARFSSQGSHPPQNTWKSQITGAGNHQSENIEMHLDGERINVKSYVMPAQVKNFQQSRIPTGPRSPAAMSRGATAAMPINAGIGVSPLMPTNSGLTREQLRFLNEVRQAQRTGFIYVYTSNRLRIQYIEDHYGACVVYVHPGSPLRNRVAIGDVIVALDGDLIRSPWDMELHYSWTEVEKLRWQDGSYRVFWVWLGMY